MGRRAVSEEPSEQWTDLFAHESDKFEQDEFDALLGTGRTLVEKYSRLELQVWVEFEAWCGPDDHRHYLAVFQGFPCEANLRFSHTLINNTDGRRCRDFTDNVENEHELSMFVDGIELVDFRQELPGLRSVVRLYRFDNGEYVWANWTPQRNRSQDGQSATGVQLGPTGPHREHGGHIGFVAADTNKLPSKMVQGDSEVVDAIPDHGPPHRTDSGRRICPVDVARAVRIWLSDEGIETLINPTPDIILEGFQVEICRADLDIKAIKRGPTFASAPTHGASEQAVRSSDAPDRTASPQEPPLGPIVRSEPPCGTSGYERCRLR